MIISGSYFFSNRSTCPVYLFHLGFSPEKVKNMEKLSSNRAQPFERIEYKFFTLGGTVALRCPIPIFYDRRATDLMVDLQLYVKIRSALAAFGQ